MRQQSGCTSKTQANPRNNGTSDADHTARHDILRGEQFWFTSRLLASPRDPFSGTLCKINVNANYCLA